jgi:DNA-binding MarR family transcriptional regulator
MSIRIPTSGGRQRPTNLGIALREAFVAVNDLMLARLAELGHSAVRASHSAVFQFLDDTGTTVQVLAQRAQMTKQAMAELVKHLEAHGYLTRSTDPEDRRAKLVRPTESGREIMSIAQDLVPELERRVTQDLSPHRVRALRRDLETIRRTASEEVLQRSSAPPPIPRAGSGTTRGPSSSRSSTTTSRSDR